MRKYREDINAIIEANRAELEEKIAYGMSVVEKHSEITKEEMLDCFRKTVLFPLLTTTMKVQWYAYHCFIDENLVVRGDDDDWMPKADFIRDMPVLDMPCATETDNRAGLYFLGMGGRNPITEQDYYLVKVGRAQNVAERIKQYAITNPMVYTTHCIYPVDNGREEAVRLERVAHETIAKLAYARAQNAREWFYVDKETYMMLCQTCSTITGWERLLEVE